MSTPWGIFATIFNKAFNTQAEGEKARVAGEQQNRQDLEAQGMEYGSSNPMGQREAYSAGSPHQIGMNMDIGGAAVGHPMKQVLGQAIAGNEAWMSPNIQTTGATMKNDDVWKRIYQQYGGYYG